MFSTARKAYYHDSSDRKIGIVTSPFALCCDQAREFTLLRVSFSYMISNADIQTAFERTPELYDELMEKVLGLAAKTESRGGPSSAELLSAQLKLAQGTEEKKSVTSSVIQKGRRMSAMLDRKPKWTPCLLSPREHQDLVLQDPSGLGGGSGLTYRCQRRRRRRPSKMISLR